MLASKVERPGRVPSAPHLPPTTVDMSSLLRSQSVRPCGVSVRPCTVPSLRRSAWVSISFASLIFLSLRPVCSYAVCRRVPSVAIEHAAFLTLSTADPVHAVIYLCWPVRMCKNRREAVLMSKNHCGPVRMCRNYCRPVLMCKNHCGPVHVRRNYCRPERMCRNQCGLARRK